MRLWMSKTRRATLHRKRVERDASAKHHPVATDLTGHRRDPECFVWWVEDLAG
jgi:hypothetical protein